MFKCKNKKENVSGFRTIWTVFLGELESWFWWISSQKTIHSKRNSPHCITPTVIPSYRLKLSTTVALRNPPRAACTSSGFPNPKCRLMRLPCALRSPPSPSPLWRVILWRTWLELLPRNPRMFRCGLKSQVLRLFTSQFVHYVHDCFVSLGCFESRSTC